MKLEELNNEYKGEDGEIKNIIPLGNVGTQELYKTVKKRLGDNKLYRLTVDGWEIDVSGCYPESIYGIEERDKLLFEAYDRLKEGWEMIGYGDSSLVESGYEYFVYDNRSNEFFKHIHRSLIPQQIYARRKKEEGIKASDIRSEFIERMKEEMKEAYFKGVVSFEDLFKQAGGKEMTQEEKQQRVSNYKEDVIERFNNKMSKAFGEKDEWWTKEWRKKKEEKPSDELELPDASPDKMYIPLKVATYEKLKNICSKEEKTLSEKISEWVDADTAQKKAKRSRKEVMKDIKKELEDAWSEEQKEHPGVNTREASEMAASLFEIMTEGGIKFK